MKHGYSESFLKNISDRSKKIISIDELKQIAQQSMGENYEEKKTYKLIHLAKSKDILLSLNKNEFFINKSGQAINEDAIIDELYTPLFLQNCKNLCGSNRYVGGIKGLELYNGISDYPDSITIYTNNKLISSHTILLGKKIIFKNLQTSGKDDRRKIVKKHINNTLWGGKKIQVGSIEICILEALYSTPFDQKNYTNEIIKKTLKKIKKSYNLSIIEQLVKAGKFHSPLNRLLELSQNINQDLYLDLEKIIKKHSYNLSSRI